MTHDPDHGPIQAPYHDMLNRLAIELDERFNPTPLPGLGERRRKIGFFLTLYEFDKAAPDGRVNYISNTERLDVKTMLQDLLQRIEAREAMDKAGPPKGTA